MKEERGRESEEKGGRVRRKERERGRNREGESVG